MPNAQKPMNPLAYLKRELAFPLGEWQGLTDDEKAWYREAAAEEMDALGLLRK